MDYFEIVASNCKRIAELGEWPAWIPPESLFERVPVLQATNNVSLPQGDSEAEAASSCARKAEGFDAGIACALDLIPRDKQRLSAVLHAAYTPAAVEQVRREIKQLWDALRGNSNWQLDKDEEGNIAEFEAALEADNMAIVEAANTETCWWLLACSFCQEEGQTASEFEEAINSFYVCSDLNYRLNRALKEADKMSKSFRLTEGVCPPGIPEGIALATRDGGMQGAYICGHEVAIQPMNDIWFVGTYHASLGLPEDFAWEKGVSDADGRPTSGPVHGSKAFVKAANLNELKRVLEAIHV